jgi:hypothetical protein
LNPPGGIAPRRLVAQRLAGNPLGSPVAVVRHLLAVQSQDYPGAAWAIAQRLDGATPGDIDRAFDAGELIRTHVLRPTWHFVAPEDLRWLLQLTGPRRIRGAAHRHRALEIDGALAARAMGVFERAIAMSGPRTRQELADALGAAGIEADVGRMTHLVIWAEAEALLCSGPRRGSSHTYALVDARVPPARARDAEESLAEVARRYVAGHGPAQDVDLAWWSGLNVGEARRGLAAASPSLQSEVIGGRRFWFADDPAEGRPAPAPTMHLLPNYDELLVAFRDRADGLHPLLPPGARVAEEILNHVIVRDGLVVGRWQRPTVASGPVVRLEPRVSLDADDRARLRSAVARYAAFLGRKLEAIGLDAERR